MRATTGLSVRRHRPASLVSSLPSFGLMCATALAFLVFFLMIFIAPWPSTGIYVSIRVKDGANLLTPPIVVRIKPNPSLGLAPKLYVNSVAVEWNGLQQALKNELKLRPDWVVYIDGDSNLSWQYVVDVADIARGLSAKVVLLTPETRRLVESDSTERELSRE